MLRKEEFKDIWKFPFGTALQRGNFINFMRQERPLYAVILVHSVDPAKDLKFIPIKSRAPKRLVKKPWDYWGQEDNSSDEDN